MDIEDESTIENTQWKEPKPLTAEEIEQLKSEAYAKYKAEDVNTDLMTQDIDWRLGQRFDAHGITKVGVPNHLTQLLTLLNNGIDPERDFHTAPLEVNPDDRAALGAGFGTSGGTATKDGSFLVMAEIDKKLSESGIKYVVVNDSYYNAVDRLSEAYPKVKFIRADQINDELKEGVK